MSAAPSHAAEGDATPPAGLGAPLLVYDGDCGFCTRSVRFILDRDRRHRRMQFASRDGEAGRAVRARHPRLATVESLLYVERRPDGERVHTHSDAVLKVAEYLGGPWAILGALGRVVPRALRDPAYALVARLRKRLVPRNAVCTLPTAEESARMLG